MTNKPKLEAYKLGTLGLLELIEGRYTQAESILTDVITMIQEIRREEEKEAGS